VRHLKFVASGISGRVKFKTHGELHLEDDNAHPVDEVVKLVREQFKNPDTQFSKIKFTPMKGVKP